MKNLIFLSFLLVSSCAYSAEVCNDPGLKPETKKACVELEKICKEIGCSVAVK